MMQKKSAWIWIGYPESMSPDWKETLIKSHLPAAVSPLHDKDCKEDGSLVKPHYHFVVKWPGPTTANVANDLKEEMGCVMCEPCLSLYGSYRYLCHLDNPEKYQYDTAEITNINNFRQYLNNDASYKLASTEDLIAIIAKYDINSLSVLTDFVRDARPELLGSLACNAKFYLQYMRSRIYGEREKLENGVFKVDGEWVTRDGERVDVRKTCSQQ